MRLKSILKEEKRKEYLWDLVHEEYQVTQPLMIRGTDYEIDRYEEKKIRKDREPRDTGEVFDIIVSGIEDGFYPNVPKRSESKFAATPNERAQVQQYGDFIYYCFAHESASIFSLPHDGIFYFPPNKLGHSLDTFLSNIDKTNYPNLYEFVKTYHAISQESKDPNQIYSIVKKSWDEIVKESVEVFDRENNSRLLGIATNIKNDLKSINAYFDNMEQGVRNSSPEILFDGPKYLIVEESYLSQNFEVTEHGLRIL